jgi:hypothetical protein
MAFFRGEKFEFEKRIFSLFFPSLSLSAARECRADAANKLRADFYRFRVDAFHLLVVVVVVVSPSLYSYKVSLI